MPLELEPDHVALVAINWGQLDRLNGNHGSGQAYGDASRRNAALTQLGLQRRSGLLCVNHEGFRAPPLDHRCHQTVAVKKEP
jgi:hypothetical protein